MAPRRQPIRLYLEKKRVHKSGYVTPATWMIRGTNEATGEAIKRSTGCIVDPENDIDETQQAEEILADFVKELRAEQKPMAKAKMLDAEDVLVADVISYYIDFRITNWRPGNPKYKKPVARPEEVLSRLNDVLEFFGEMSVDEIELETCQDFIDTQATAGAARRKLEDLRSAINLAVDAKKLKHAVKIWLPEKQEPRQTILTPSEVAQLLWTAYKRKGTAFIDARPVKDAYIWRHLVPYVLTALYTGTRKSRIVRASFVREKGRPFIDVRTGAYYRLATGEIAPRTKQAPTVQMPPNLVAHMRRWRKMGRKYVIEYQGGAVDNLSKSLRACIREAFGEHTAVVPHTLRHTMASWLMSDPTLPLIDIAEYLGMTVETLVRVYGKIRKDQGDKIATAIHGRLRNKLGITPNATGNEWISEVRKHRAA
ncbi:tyrosine-type recombinase/integrase [Rhizobium johnstonii]|uniref:tyrosine-type recombinase/integrase n=1 Tax=Rhizobium johnstonii TaxID=3019933 RepID=UPI003F9C4B53